MKKIIGFFFLFIGIEIFFILWYLPSEMKVLINLSNLKLFIFILLINCSYRLIFLYCLIYCSHLNHRFGWLKERIWMNFGRSFWKDLFWCLLFLLDRFFSYILLFFFFFIKIIIFIYLNLILGLAWTFICNLGKY